MNVKLKSITSIERKTGKKRVHDLTVKNDHSYCVFNVIVHNSICSTRINTGYGVPTFESLRRICACKRPGVYVVADGGHEHSGDLVKALAIGADMVMLGKMLAATSLSPGAKYGENLERTDDINEFAWVAYRGMASKEVQDGFSSRSKSVEGVSGLIPYSGTTPEVLDGILANLKSAMAYYGGCTSWEELRRSSKFLQVTHQGWIESGTRVENTV